MADNLRDRIARAAQRHAESSSRLGENTEPAVSKTENLRDRIAEVLCEDGQRPMHTAMRLADAVIAELTDAIPPIVATAIQGYVQAELAAISHHGEAAEYEMLKRLDREALQIAKYATTHKDWNG